MIRRTTVSFSLFATAILVLILATGSHAQDSNPSDRTQYIQFSVESGISPDSDTFGHMPTGLLDQLVEYNSLRRVDLTRSAEGDYNLRASFIFLDLQQFKEWYHSDDVQSLLTNLEKTNPDYFQVQLNIEPAINLQKN